MINPTLTTGELLQPRSGDANNYGVHAGRIRGCFCRDSFACRVESHCSLRVMRVRALRALELTQEVLHAGGREDRRALLKDAAACALTEADQLRMHMAHELDSVRSSEEVDVRLELSLIPWRFLIASIDRRLEQHNALKLLDDQRQR